jgi:hypothetical protein
MIPSPPRHLRQRGIQLGAGAGGDLFVYSGNICKIPLNPSSAPYYPSPCDKISLLTFTEASCVAKKQGTMREAVRPAVVQLPALSLV